LEYLYTATATDPDNLVLDVNFDNYAGWLSVTGNTIHGIPPFGSNDTTFRIIVSDGELADSLVVSLIVKSGCVYLPGDINSDSSVLGGDVTFAVRFFKGLGNQPPDSCYLDSTGSYLYVAGDINGNCEFRGSDVTRLVAYFKGTAEMSYCHFFAPPPLIKIVRNQTPVNLSKDKYKSGLDFGRIPIQFLERDASFRVLFIFADLVCFSPRLFPRQSQLRFRRALPRDIQTDRG
jgi:hypothetical protein